MSNLVLVFCFILNLYLRISSYLSACRPLFKVWLSNLRIFACRLSPVLWIYVTRTFSLSISNPKCYIGLMVLLNSSGNWFKLLSLCVKIFELLDWESMFEISPILLSFTNYWAFWITSFKDLWASSLRLSVSI